MYPPHPGRDSGTAFLSFLGHGVPASRGLGKLGPAVLHVLQAPPVGPRRGCCATLPTKVQAQVQPRVGWEHSSAPSCRTSRISSFHELDFLFKLTRASERRPSTAVYPCSTSAHLLPLRGGCNLPACRRVSTLLPMQPCSSRTRRARGRVFFSLFACSTHSTVLPSPSTWV